MTMPSLRTSERLSPRPDALAPPAASPSKDTTPSKLSGKQVFTTTVDGTLHAVIASSIVEAALLTRGLGKGEPTKLEHLAAEIVAA